MSESARPLTAKRLRFVEEYLIDANASRAARAAGYSAASAASIGSELLAMPNVRAAIEAGQAERSAQLGVKAHTALERLARIAFADIDGCLKPGPDGIRRLDLSDLTADKLAAIGDVSFDADGRPQGCRFRIANQRLALVALLRHLPKPGLEPLPRPAPPPEEEPWDDETVLVAPPVRDANGDVVAPARDVAILRRGPDGSLIRVPLTDESEEISESDPPARPSTAAEQIGPAAPADAPAPSKTSGNDVVGPPPPEEAPSQVSAEDLAYARRYYPDFREIAGEDAGTRARRFRAYAVNHVDGARAIRREEDRKAHLNRNDRGKVRRIREAPEVNARWWPCAAQRPAVLSGPSPAHCAGEGRGGGGAKRRKGQLPAAPSSARCDRAPTPTLPRDARERHEAYGAKAGC